LHKDIADAKYLRIWNPAPTPWAGSGGRPMNSSHCPLRHSFRKRGGLSNNPPGLTWAERFIVTNLIYRSNAWMKKIWGVS